MLTINEQIHVDDAPGVRPSVMLTINETIGVTDAPTAAGIDTTPPVVTVPGNMTVLATGPNGGPAEWFATAFDNISGQLVPVCAPGIGSTFPIGTTTVTCTAVDAAGNVGSASFTVTVIVGVPNLVIRVTGQGRDPVGGFYLDMEFNNNGTGMMSVWNIQSLVLKTLTGTGTVTYTGNLVLVPSQATNYPPGIGYGRMYFNVPSTVKRFSLTLSGNFANALGVFRTYSFGQAVIP
jgi:hypothetical protein